MSVRNFCTSRTAHNWAIGLQVVASASGRSKSSLLKPQLEKLQPPIEKRRLMPLKHAAVQIGNAAAFTYVLQQRPSLLPLSQASFRFSSMLLLAPIKKMGSWMLWLFCNSLHGC